MVVVVAVLVIAFAVVVVSTTFRDLVSGVAFPSVIMRGGPHDDLAWSMVSTKLSSASVHWRFGPTHQALGNDFRHYSLLYKTRYSLDAQPWSLLLSVEDDGLEPLGATVSRGTRRSRLERGSVKRICPTASLRYFQSPCQTMLHFFCFKKKCRERLSTNVPGVTLAKQASVISSRGTTQNDEAPLTLLRAGVTRLEKES